MPIDYSKLSSASNSVATETPKNKPTGIDFTKLATVPSRELTQSENIASYGGMGTNLGVGYTNQFDFWTSPTVDAYERRAQDQSIGQRILHGVGRLASTAVTKTLQGVGHIAGIPGAIAFGDISAITDNGWVNFFANAEEKLKEWMPVYKTRDYLNGSVWQQMGTASFWTDDFVDGVAFMASAFIPSTALIKGIGTAGKLASLGIKGLKGVKGFKGLQLGNKLAKTFTNTLKQAKYLERASELGYNQMKLAGALDNLSISALASTMEAGFEARGTQLAIEDSLRGTINPDTGRAYTDAEIKAASSEAAKNTYFFNLALLSATNLVEARAFSRIFGRTNKVAGKGLEKLTRAKKLKAFGYGALSTSFSEGIIEENVQLAIEDLSSDHNLKNMSLGEKLSTIGNNWVDNFSTDEGQKSMVLGALIGLLPGGIGKVASKKQEIENRNKANQAIHSGLGKFKAGQRDVFLWEGEGEDAKIVVKNGVAQKDLNKIDSYVKARLGNDAVALAKYHAVENNDRNSYHAIIKDQLSMHLYDIINSGITGKGLEVEIDSFIDAEIESLSTLGIELNQNDIAEFKDLKSLFLDQAKKAEGYYRYADNIANSIQRPEGFEEVDEEVEGQIEEFKDDNDIDSKKKKETSKAKVKKAGLSLQGYRDVVRGSVYEALVRRELATELLGRKQAEKQGLFDYTKRYEDEAAYIDDMVQEYNAKKEYLNQLEENYTVALDNTILDERIDIIQKELEGLRKNIKEAKETLSTKEKSEEKAPLVKDEFIATEQGLTNEPQFIKRKVTKAEKELDVELEAIKKLIEENQETIDTFSADKDLIAIYEKYKKHEAISNVVYEARQKDQLKSDLREEVVKNSKADSNGNIVVTRRAKQISKELDDNNETLNSLIKDVEAINKKVNGEEEATNKETTPTEPKENGQTPPTKEGEKVTPEKKETKKDKGDLKARKDAAIKKLKEKAVIEDPTMDDIDEIRGIFESDIFQLFELGGFNTGSDTIVKGKLVQMIFVALSNDTNISEAVSNSMLQYVKELGKQEVRLKEEDTKEDNNNKKEAGEDVENTRTPADEAEPIDIDSSGTLRIYISSLLGDNASRQTMEGDVYYDTKALQIYKALKELQLGTELTLEVDKDNNSYDEHKDNKDRVPVKITFKFQGKDYVIGHINIAPYLVEEFMLSELLLDNEAALDGLYKKLQKQLDKFKPHNSSSPQHKEAVSEFVKIVKAYFGENGIFVKETQFNNGQLLNSDNTQFGKSPLQFGKHIYKLLYNNNQGRTIESWRDKIAGELEINNKVREQLANNPDGIVTAWVDDISGGSVNIARKSGLINYRPVSKLGLGNVTLAYAENDTLYDTETGEPIKWTEGRDVSYDTSSFYIVTNDAFGRSGEDALQPIFVRRRPLSNTKEIEAVAANIRSIGEKLKNGTINYRQVTPRNTGIHVEVQKGAIVFKKHLDKFTKEGKRIYELYKYDLESGKVYYYDHTIKSYVTKDGLTLEKALVGVRREVHRDSLLGSNKDSKAYKKEVLDNILESDVSLIRDHTGKAVGVMQVEGNHEVADYKKHGAGRPLTISLRFSDPKNTNNKVEEQADIEDVKQTKTKKDEKENLQEEKQQESSKESREEEVNTKVLEDTPLEEYLDEQLELKSKNWSYYRINYGGKAKFSTGRYVGKYKGEDIILQSNGDLMVASIGVRLGLHYSSLVKAKEAFEKDIEILAEQTKKDFNDLVNAADKVAPVTEEDIAKIEEFNSRFKDEVQDTGKTEEEINGDELIGDESEENSDVNPDFNLSEQGEYTPTEEEQSLLDTFEDGEEYSIRDIYNLLKGSNLSNFLKLFLSKLRPMFSTLGTKVVFTENLNNDGAIGKFDIKTNTIFLYKSAISNSYGLHKSRSTRKGSTTSLGNYFAYTFLHELIHSFTTQSVITKHLSSTNPDVKNAIEALNEIIKYLKDNSKFKGEYGITNIRELLSELSNEEFVNKLKSEKRLNNYKGENLFEQIINFIADLLGLKKESESLADEMFEILSTFITNANKDNHSTAINILTEYNSTFKEFESNNLTDNTTRNTHIRLAKIAQRYNGNKEGFFSNQIMPSKLLQEVRPFGYGVAKSRTGTYFITKPNGKKYTPKYELANEQIVEEPQVDNRDNTIESPRLSEVTKIKEGVSELFESNPELANQVYEALGFKQSVTQDNKSYYRGQIEKPTIDAEGNLVLHGREDDLYKRANLKSKGVSMTDDLKSAIEYGNSQLEVAQNLASESYDAEQELERLSDNGYYLIQIPKNISNDIAQEAGEVKVIGDNIIIPKGQYKVEQIVDGVEQITPQQKQQALQQYSAYLDTIFPDSKVKDIVYHGSPKNKLEKIKGISFWTNTSGNAYGYNIQRNNDNSPGFVTSAIVNIKNPYIHQEDITSRFATTTPKDLINKAKIQNADGAIWKDVEDIAGKETQTIIFEPEQIHILGSKQDIEGFKGYIKSNPRLLEVGDKNSEQLYPIDEEEVKVYFEENYPELSLALQDKLIKLGNKEAYGKFHRAMITLSRLAPQGTQYHEAFHYVFNNYLSVDERQEIYDEAIAEYASQGKIDLDNYTLLQIEELLAEDYKAYELTREEPKNLGEKIVEFFRQLKEYIDTLLGKADKIKYLFENIHQGNFGFTYEEEVAGVDYLMGLITNIMERSVNIVNSEGKTEKRKIRTLTRKELEANPNYKIENYLDKVIKDHIDKRYQVISERNLFDKTKDQLSEEEKLVLNQHSYLYKVKRDVKKYQKSTNKKANRESLLRKANSKLNSILNVKVTLEEDFEDINENIRREGYNSLTKFWFDDLAYSESSDTGMQINTKLAIARLFQYETYKDDKGEIRYRKRINPITGYYEYINFKSEYPRILYELSGVITKKQLGERLTRMKHYLPYANQLIKFLNEDKQLLQAFMTDFSKPILTHNYIQINPNESFLDYSNKPPSYVMSNSWAEDIKEKMEDGYFKDELFSEYKKHKVSLAKRVKANDYKGIESDLTSMYNLLGIGLTSDVIKLYITDPNVLARFKATEEEVKTTTEENVKLGKLIHELVSQMNNFIDRDLKGKTEFKGYWALNSLSDKFYKYSSLPIEHTAAGVDGNQFYAVTELSQIIEFYNKTRSKYGRELLFKQLMEYIDKDPRMKYSNWIANFLTRDAEGNLKLDTDFLSYFRVNPVDGIKNIYNRSYKKFKNAKAYELAVLELMFFHNRDKNSNKEDQIRIFTPIPGDSANILSISLPKISSNVKVEDGVNKIGRKSAGYKALLNLVKQEVEAMRQAKALYHVYEGNIEIGVDIDQTVKNYHYKVVDGNEVYVENNKVVGEVFKFKNIGTINELDIFDEHGILREDFNPESDEVYNAINEFVNKEYDRLMKVYRPFKQEFNKMYKDVSFNNTIYDLLINQYVNHVEYGNFFNGTLSEHIDMSKYTQRAKKVNQKGKSNAAVDGNKKVKVAVSKDRVVTSPIVKAIKKMVYDSLIKRGHSDSEAARESSKVSGFYKSINAADGQGFMILNRWINEQKRYGNWDLYSHLFNVVNNNGRISYKLRDGINVAELERVFQVIKPVLADRSISQFDTYSMLTTKYLKYSSLPLIEELTKDIPLLDSLRKTMEDNNIDEFVFESVEKEGTTYVSNLETEDGAINPSYILESDTKEFDETKFRWQLDVPDHNIDVENKIGTQIYKHIISNIESSTIYKDFINGKELNGDEVKDLHHNIISELIRLESDKVISDLGLTSKSMFNLLHKEAMNRKEGSLNKVSELLIRMAENSESTSDAIWGVSTNDTGSAFNVPLDFSGSRRKNIPVLQSLFTNRVTDLKFPGSHLVLASNVFYDIRSSEGTQVENLLSSKIDDQGRLVVECAMGAWSKDFFDKDGNEIPIENLSDDLKTMLGYRIPTSGKHSMVIFKVVKFLPRLSGSTIILPQELVAQTGWDFDVDSLFIMRYNHIKFSKVSVSNEEIVAEINKKLEEEEAGSAISVEQLDKLYTEAKATDFKKRSSKQHIIHNTFNEANKGDRFDVVPYAEDNDKLDLANKEQLQNKLLALWMGILSNRYHTSEQLTPANMEKNMEVKKRLEKILNIDNQTMNPLLPSNQLKIMDLIAISKETLGISANSVAIDTIFQSIDTYLHKPIKVAYKTSQPNVGGFVGKYRGKSNSVRVIEFDQVARSPLGFRNIDGIDILHQEGENVNNAVDGFKVGLIPGFNDISINIYMLLEKVGARVEDAAFFSAQEAVRLLYIHRGINEAKALMSGKKYSYVRSAKNALLTEIYKLMRNYGGEELNNISKDSGKYDKQIKDYGMIMPTRNSNILEELGLSSKLLFLTERELELELKKYANKNQLSNEQKLKYYKRQWEILNTYEYYKEIADGILDLSMVLRADKIGLGKSFEETKQLESKIKELAEAEDKVLVNENGENIIHDIYPNITMPNKNRKSKYASMQSYLEFSNLLGYDTLSPLFATESPAFEVVTSKFKELYQMSLNNKDMIGMLEKLKDYLNGYLIAKNVNLSLTDKEQKRILGLTSTDRTNSVARKVAREKAKRKMSPSKVHWLNYLDPHTSKSERERNEGVEIVSLIHTEKNNDLLDKLQRTMLNDYMMGLDSDRELIKDLVRYAFLVDGLSYTRQGIRHLIPMRILYDMGIINSYREGWMEALNEENVISLFGDSVEAIDNFVANSNIYNIAPNVYTDLEGRLIDDTVWLSSEMLLSWGTRIFNSPYITLNDKDGVVTILKRVGVEETESGDIDYVKYQALEKRGNKYFIEPRYNESSIIPANKLTDKMLQVENKKDDVEKYCKGE
jgi:hypothetical protein